MAVVPAPVVLRIRGTSDGLTDRDAAAIAGSVVGSIIAILLMIFCCIKWTRYQSEIRRVNRRRHRSSSAFTSSSSSSSSSTSSEDRERPIRGVPVRPPPRAARPPPVRVSQSVRESVRVSERIPGGPRYPTYKAIPIPNPRNNPKVKHKA
ncbi:uncharacterized protein F5Z01DRAFT_642393 [Emericellopsis atlantica]|uniref:Uncharacterized protein n=1 Tax=Emericellopsis atlantica TaxID=2614577 RepID=A0A9P7ZVI0_9HYPO|nr:uncharacterized protein F5Z01DRAFT_642393 [Emericellopsis atlantica]KAG9259129.1 hypothetical protein F5Z01DRAFT_642393 [Emericellopsis atlantica]